MIPHHHHHHSTSVTDTIDFFSEQSPFYAESIQIAKQAYKNKPQALVFPQQVQPIHQDQLSPLREVSSWFDDESELNETVNKSAPSPVNQPFAVHEDQVFLDGGNCDFDMDFFDTTPAVQQPSSKKVKYEHHHEVSSSNPGQQQHYSNSLMEASSSTPAVKPSSQDNLLSILLREQQKQGAEITELKQMVHNLQAQIMMHPMYQQQFMLYQQHQQQQYQLYLQQQHQQQNNSQHQQQNHQ
ncbi:hypothetical protein C9374_011017 [Naegleria lovaniensis]|uniref:Uncharacterized protein n=1 Tax=Naegleria lovaniensis TaxID=51637 RepID=A0AA88KCU6_NAELO|nr:uncharacterized protein C9374_011017 [Naegleria lovaniensis]KAG2374180.1 hypothetical protein C9374_011017 [Naegleria lovaniensis]